MKIYLVEGRTGEYEEYHTWIAAAFKEQSKAQEMARHPDLNVKFEKTMIWFDSREEIEQKGKLIDPAYNCDYTGSSYHVIEMDLQ